MTDEKFVQDLAKTEATGKSRYGDRWQCAIDAISRQGGIGEGAMRQIVSGPDPAGLIYTPARKRCCSNLIMATTKASASIVKCVTTRDRRIERCEAANA